MTREEAIKIIEVAKAEVEWEAPLDYQIAFDLAMEALKQPAQQWIPMSERLPKDRGAYIACTDLGTVGECVYKGNGEWDTDKKYCFSLWGRIVAWMPLPEPYKEEYNERV